MDKENRDKAEMALKMQQIEEERRRLREEQKIELKRLEEEKTDFNLDVSYSEQGVPHMMTQDDPEFLNTYMMTSDNPELNELQYKYDEEALKKELDGLSYNLDNDEIVEFQNRIQELENQVQNLENEKDEFERKYYKELNSKQYLETQIVDYEQKITDLKAK